MIRFESKFIIRVALMATLIHSLTFCRVSKLEQDLDSIQLVVKYPLLTLLEEKLYFIELKDTLTIDHYKDFVLYKLTATRRFETNEKIPGTETYFFYKKGSKYGLWLSSLDTIGKKKVLVDSFAKARAFSMTGFYIRTSDTVVETVQQNQKQFILKLVPQQEDEMTFDSIYYHFNTDLKDIDYTFSAMLDSAKQSKLCKIQLIHNATYSQTYKMVLPKREHLFEIRKVPTENVQKKVALIKELSKMLP